MTVAAVVEEAGGEFALQDVGVGELHPGEVLIDLRASGVCHTDLGARAGAYPTPLPCLLGHERAGVISVVAPGVHGLAVGDRVAIPSTVRCSCSRRRSEPVGWRGARRDSSRSCSRGPGR